MTRKRRMFSYWNYPRPLFCSASPFLLRDMAKFLAGGGKLPSALFISNDIRPTAR